MEKRQVIYTDEEKSSYRDYIYDNFDSIVDFFTRNIALTPQGFSGQLADRPATSDSNWGDQEERMLALGIVPHPLLGKCYHAVRFFQYLGCWDNFEAYTIYKKIPHKLPNEFTTHWFLKDKKTGQILDPTDAQFDYLDINEYYNLGQRAGGRLCYYGFNPKYKVYDTFVPPVTTRKLGRKYQEEFGTAAGLQKWFDEEAWWIQNKDTFKNHTKQTDALEKFFA